MTGHYAEKSAFPMAARSTHRVRAGPRLIQVDGVATSAEPVAVAETRTRSAIRCRKQKRRCLLCGARPRLNVVLEERRMLKKWCLAIATLLALGVTVVAQGPAAVRLAPGDWPEMRGQNRDGTSRKQGC